MAAIEKKGKDKKKLAIPRKLKFETYKHCLEAIRLENKIKYPEKNKVDVDTAKSQQRFKSRKHNAFAEKVNKIALSANDNKRTQLIQYRHMHMKMQYTKKKKLNIPI